MSAAPGGLAATPSWACVRLEWGGDGAHTLATLQRFSPRVAPVPGYPHVFRLDVGGMVGLYPSHRAWARALVTELTTGGAKVWLAVGFNPFCLLMLAHALPQAFCEAPQDLFVAPSPKVERTAVHSLPLSASPLSEAAAHVAEELGLRTLGCLLRLPTAEVAQALGGEALALHRLAHTGDGLPLAPVPLPIPCVVESLLEPPDADSTRLLFVCKALLPALVHMAQERQAVLAAIDVTLVQEAPNTLLRRPGEEITQTIEAGRPGRDEAPWLTLMRLALEAWPLGRAVQAVRLTGRLQAPPRQQLQLWPDAGAARDEVLTTAAISQLRARFGDAAITCAQLQPSHRPEAQFAYAPTTKLATVGGPRARVPGPPRDLGQGRPLVRRLLAVPAPLSQAQLRLLQRLRAPQRAPASAVSHLQAVPQNHDVPCGPFKLSHGWWQAPCDRDYYYVPQDKGAWLWVFYDRQARQWRLHGHVD